MRFFYILILGALIQAIYFYGFDKTFDAIYVQNFWTSTIMTILIVFYFILSLNPANYWKGRRKRLMNDAIEEMKKLEEDSETRAKEINNAMPIKQKVIRKNTIKHKYKKA